MFSSMSQCLKSPLCSVTQVLRNYTIQKMMHLYSKMYTQLPNLMCQFLVHRIQLQQPVNKNAMLGKQKQKEQLSIQ